MRGHSRGKQWEKLKPLARQMRKEPTPAEEKLYEALRDRRLAGIKFRRQYSVGPFIVDFVALKPKLVVELDGSVHDLTPEQDAVRQAFIETAGFRVLRFRNGDVLAHLDDVLGRIVEAAQ